MNSSGKILIIGAGPTGLGAALRLQELGHEDWELWEAGTEPGGLAGSVVDEHGFTWDMGGHVQFSHYGTFDRWMDEALGPDGWLTHERESWVRIFGTWVAYPFQNNIHRLPPEHATRALEDLRALVKAAAGRPPRPGDFANFGELITGQFGETIAQLFLRPYNFKVWAYPPAELGVGWVGERVALPDLEKINAAFATGHDNVSWGPNTTFRFPRKGGTGEVWRQLAKRLPPEKLKFNRAVTEIDVANRKLKAGDGAVVKYDHLISTKPLDLLANMTQRKEWIEATNLLRYSTVHIIGVGLNGQPGADLARKCWMYFPESNCPFYRVTVFSNYSPGNVPDPSTQWSLMAEISESNVKSVNASKIIEDTLAGMIATGLIDSRDKVSHTFHRRLERGYPTPSLRRDDCLNVLLPALEREGILSRGRFGAWKYEVSNQDHSMMQGVEAVNHILLGSPELTLWFPNLVNAMHPIFGKSWL